MPYAELIAKLTEIEYRPWLDRTRPRLSAILTPLGIEKQQWHIGSNHVRWATRWNNLHRWRWQWMKND